MHIDYECLPLGVMEILATLLETPAKITWKNGQYDKRGISHNFNLSVLQQTTSKHT